jgi:hypothetical protein
MYRQSYFLRSTFLSNLLVLYPESTKKLSPSIVYLNAFFTFYENATKDNTSGICYLKFKYKNCNPSAF